MSHIKPLPPTPANANYKHEHRKWYRPRVLLFQHKLDQLAFDRDAPEKRLKRLGLERQEDHDARLRWAMHQQDPKWLDREEDLAFASINQARYQPARNPFFPHARPDLFPDSNEANWPELYHRPYDHAIDTNAAILRRNAVAGQAQEKKVFHAKNEDIWDGDEAERRAPHPNSTRGGSRRKKEKEEEEEMEAARKAVDAEWEARQGKVRRYYHSGEARNPGEDEQG